MGNTRITADTGGLWGHNGLQSLGGDYKGYGFWEGVVYEGQGGQSGLPGAEGIWGAQGLRALGGGHRDCMGTCGVWKAQGWWKGYGVSRGEEHRGSCRCCGVWEER